MASRDQEEKISLVLSIFKGENFVCKNISGLRCQIEAKCYGQTLESGVISILTKNSEPVFNSQLAWQFTRRELKEIRVNKETVKVRCLLLSDESKNPTEVGYAILYVKDAFPMLTIGEVDPLKAVSYPLLGTKDQWKSYHPKLQMQLHLEERSQSQQIIDNPASSITRKTKTESPVIGAKAGVGIGKKLSLDVVDSASKAIVIKDKMAGDPFSWQINEDDGCFVLGNPSESDDLYILNITIISASYLQLLWNGRSPKKASSDDFVWQVKYKAYGVEIKSDPFILSNDDDSRRTFIGDKATARIRANGAMFCEYLQKSAVEFHVVRFQLSHENQLINEEVMGVSFVELEDLTKPDVVELKSTLEIVSEWGYPRVVDQSEKPEVRVVFQLDAVPDFFANYKSFQEIPVDELQYSEGLNDVSKNVSRTTTPKDNISLGNGDKKDTVNTASPIKDMTDRVRQMNLNEEITKTPAERDAGELSDLNRELTAKSEEKLKSNSKNIETINELFEESAIHESETDKSSKRKIEKTPKSNSTYSSSHESSSSSSASSSSNTSHRSRPETTDSISSPEKEHPSFQDEYVSSTSDISDKENLKSMIPSPGAFEVTIGLSKFWIKSQVPLNRIVLSYIYPLFGVVDEPVICTGKPSSEIQHKKPNYQCMILEDGISTMKVSIPKFSEKIINNPMTVEFRKYTKKFLEPTFGFSLIPIGGALLQQEKNGVRTLKGYVEILKCDTNVKIGILHYFVKFTSLNLLKSPIRQHKILRSNNEQDHVDCMSQMDMKTETKSTRAIDPALVFRTVEDLTSWRLEQEQMYIQKKEQKERDYLRIVAEEVAKRDKEREKVLNEKLTELKKKDKELNQLTRRVTERENQLRSREIEVANTAQKLTLDQTSALENTKISVRRIQEEYQIELSSLQRRNAEYEAELEKIKGKLVIFERKLEEKDDVIRKLTAESHARPDSRLSEKMKLLEQENKLLKKQVIEIEKSREQYKKQSQTLCHKLARLQEERDKQLKDENDNLRLQILASKEHAELKKERKAVADLSQTIRVLQDTAKTKIETNVKGRQSDKKRSSESHGAKENEIARLTQVRNGLLSTGAYTQYDMVIKEMERKIVGLAQGDGEDVQ